MAATLCSSNFTYHSASQVSKSLIYNKYDSVSDVRSTTGTHCAALCLFGVQSLKDTISSCSPTWYVAIKKLSPSQLWLSFPAAGTKWVSSKMNCKHCIFAAAMNLFTALPNG